MAISKAKAYGGSRSTVSTFRSGLEEKIAAQLEGQGLPVIFEKYKLKYIIPESVHSYTPDFVLHNGLIVESKGIFDSDDRKKHQLIKEQHPELDIRFVFSSSKAKLYKGSSTSSADWCVKNGFKYADKLIPADWLKESKKIIPEGILIAKG